MTAGIASADTRSPGRIAAAETGRRSRELRLRADSATTAAKRAWPRQAFDGGTPPPPIQDEQLRRLQTIDRDEARAWMDECTRPYGINAKSRRLRVSAGGHVLGWLERFDGTTWDERWLKSGLDQAPREGLTELSQRLGLRRGLLSTGVTTLVRSRLVRPSYEWLFSSKQWSRGRGEVTFLDASEPVEAARLRSLPEYQRTHEFGRRSAENAIERIMVRTGKRLNQLVGEDVLAYSHIARLSRRLAKEHLAWELLVALGPLAGEPPTLRAAWHASVSSRQHTVRTLVDRYAIPPSGVRDLLIEYLEEVKPGMDYASLQSLAYQLVRLFWAEIIDINPAQKDLRLAPDVARQWRERMRTTLEAGLEATRRRPSSRSGPCTGTSPNGRTRNQSVGPSGSRPSLCRTRNPGTRPSSGAASRPGCSSAHAPSRRCSQPSCAPLRISGNAARDCCRPLWPRHTTRSSPSTA